MRFMPRFRTAKRFSSSRFSEVILTDNNWLICSWSDHSSSNDMASKSNFFIDILRPFGITIVSDPLQITEHLVSYNWRAYSASRPNGGTFTFGGSTSRFPQQY